MVNYVVVLFVIEEIAEYLNKILLLPEDEIPKQLLKVLYPEFSEVMDKADRVLCIAPHPDDCEIGAGGTIASLAKKKRKIHILVATDGSMGTFDPGLSPARLVNIRKAEQEEAARILGVETVYWLGYRDTSMPYNEEARLRIVHFIRLLKPDLVFVPDPWLTYEAHPDHRVVGLLASESVLFSSLPHYGCGDVEVSVSPWSPKYIAFYYTSRPNMYYDISETMNTKLYAMKMHKSQFEKSWGYFETLVKFIGLFYGKKIGVKYAEAFKIIPIELLHLAIFTEKM